MKPYTKILKKPYSVVEEGRGNTTTFEKPRLWVRNACPNMWQRYKKDPKPFQLFWSEPNTSKFHGSVAYGEYVPFKGTRLVLIHNTNLRDQHSEHLKHWVDTDYVRNHWRVMTIQGVDALIKKVEKNSKLDEQQKRDKEFIDRVSFAVLDELHRYSKNDQDKIQMITRIMKYMLSKNLKLALGTTATARGVTAAWEIFGGEEMLYKQKQYTYRTTIQELSAEGWKPVPTSYIWVDKETTLEDNTSNWSFESLNEDSVRSDLKEEGHDLIFTKEEMKIYVDNRIDAGIEHYFKHQGEVGGVGIMSINGIQNALDAEAKYQSKFEKAGYKCIAWNSESKNNHPVYKDNERKMLSDLFDETHPLRFVFVNGMLQEGTNKPFKVAYQANYSPYNPDRSIQFGARAQEAFVIIDAPIIKGLKQNPYVAEMIENILTKAGEQMTPEEFAEARKRAEVYKAGITIESQRQGSITEEGKTPDTKADIDYIFDSLANGNDDDDGNSSITINGNKVFVYDVDHKGNLVNVPLNVGNQIHRSLNQKATSAIEVFGV